MRGNGHGPAFADICRDEGADFSLPIIARDDMFSIPRENQRPAHVAHGDGFPFSGFVALAWLDDAAQDRVSAVLRLDIETAAHVGAKYATGNNRDTASDQVRAGTRTNATASTFDESDNCLADVLVKKIPAARQKQDVELTEAVQGQIVLSNGGHPKPSLPKLACRCVIVSSTPTVNRH